MRNTVMHMLEENVRRFPGKPALADEFRSFTYAEYLDLAVRTAKRIRCALTAPAGPAGGPAGTEPARSAPGPDVYAGGRPVGVLIERNALSVAAFLGIAYSGNFYVPLDPALPAGRLQAILGELSPVMLVDAREVPGELPVPCGVPVFDMRSVCMQSDCMRSDPMQSVCAAADGAPLKGDLSAGEASAKGTSGEETAKTPEEEVTGLLETAAALRRSIIDTDPLYAIFTSGSTGVPKGVLVSHRSVLDLVDAFAEAFGFAEDAVFGNQAPFDFDVSVKDIYNALHCGGRIEVVPHRMFVMPAMLMEYLAAHGINTIIWAVSALRIVADLRTLDEMKTSVPVQLRHVMFSGEVMPVKCINYWIRFFPETVYVNLYGPTEITCNCTYHILDRHYEAGEILPIGRAFTNTRVFLLERSSDEENEDPGSTSAHPAGDGKPAQPRIIPISEPDCRGEICVEGTGVALGYWNNPARTAESFTAKPGVPATLNRIYRTGDLGYYNKEGELCFAARADNQIKHMGHRIELGEIEAALNAIEFIDVSCCFYDQKREKIVCVYQAAQDRRKEIIAALSATLPKYMRPNKYLRMEQMPLNAHAKIDRRLLHGMYDEGKLK